MTREEFLEKYHINTTFEDMYKSVNDTLSKSKGQNVDQMKYVHGLNFMFDKIMDGQLIPSGARPEYDINNFDCATFLRDYEDVMKSEHLDKNDGRARKAHEGDELKAINSLFERAKNYNKPMDDCLADKIKRGADLGEFRKVTTYDEDMSMEEKVDCKRAAGMMYRVMKKVINDRTWKDRINPLNWWRMLQENLYNRSITKEIKEHIKREPGSTHKSIINRRLVVTAGDIEYAANDYSHFGGSTVLDDEKAMEFESFCKERSAAVNSEKEIDLSGRTSMSIDELSPQNERTVDGMAKYRNVPSQKIDLDRSIDSSPDYL